MMSRRLSSASIFSTNVPIEDQDNTIPRGLIKVGGMLSQIPICRITILSATRVMHRLTASLNTVQSQGPQVRIKRFRLFRLPLLWVDRINTGKSTKDVPHLNRSITPSRSLTFITRSSSRRRFLTSHISSPSPLHLS